MNYARILHARVPFLAESSGTISWPLQCQGLNMGFI
jgi:hypothetical protein